MLFQLVLSFFALQTSLATSAPLQGDVIVYLKAQANLTSAPGIQSRTVRSRFVFEHLKMTANNSQKRLLQTLKSRGANFRSFYIENAVVVFNASPDLVEEIKKNPEVETVRHNISARLQTVAVNANEFPIEKSNIPGHLTAIQVDKVWSQLGVRGKGIVVAGQDTGYYWEHRALKNQYRGNNNGTVDHNYNWHDAISTTRSRAPMDDRGHGTHTMGTIVGLDGSQNQIGVAPEAKWMGCRNMHQGVGSLATYLECFEFFLAPYPIGGNPQTDGRPDLAPHIVNNSWACPLSEGCTGGELLASVQALKAAGIFVVAAAGNEGPNCGSVSSAPGTYTDDLFSVGAYNRYTQDIAIFSSRGPSSWNRAVAPNIVAYGEIIRSAVTGSPGSYDDKSGTSMASPQIAGVVALLWSAKPDLIGQIDRTVEILQKTARPLTSRESCGGIPGHSVPNATFGYGLVNAFAAITAP